jgi:hypothetical protein
VDDPVFVIHGVGNRDRDGFTAAVASMSAASGLEMVPVYWGDLGADDRFIEVTVPALPAAAGLRDDGDEIPGAAEPLLAALLTPPPGDWARREVETAVRESLAGHRDPDPSDVLLRDGGGPGGPDEDEVLAALADAWPTTRWLHRLDDATLLRDTGRALADAVADAYAATEADDGFAGLRDGPGESRGRLRDLVRRRLADLDRLVGAAVQSVAGRVNHALRTRFGPGTTRFLGDVLVYQRHQREIHARVRACVDAVHPELGRSPDRGVRVVAHSLGGVIAVDMATAAEPLWTRSLLTFGSQAAFFHVCDPRGGQLLPFAGDGMVRLPASLARWTNLWEPLDVLAFLASGVFRLHDGSAPEDVAVPHAASAGLWTHSVYWDLPSVATSIRDAMA